MSKPILVTTTRFLDPVEARIDQQYEARRNYKDTPLNHDELLAVAEGSDAMLITPSDRLDSDFFNQVSSSVKVIATHSVGYEHIDLRAASERKIAIANTQGANSNATAEITLLLLLAASRRAYEAQELLRSGDGNRGAFRI